MNSLIVKLGATGDVVRTTTLLHRLDGDVTWITAAKNVELLQGLKQVARTFSWEDRDQALDRDYDLVINLEDTIESGEFLRKVNAAQVHGAHLNGDGQLGYTDDARGWFDLSLISRHGKDQADRLKFLNHRTYQDLVFAGLGFEFNGEPYLLPEPAEADLRGDIALSPQAGPVWPMKNWAFYDELQALLEKAGLKVNRLPVRKTLREHMGDVRNHRCLVSGDSLPMHFALGLGVPCVTLFTCTSPWEIYDYGVQTKLTSPLLEEYFFKRGFEKQAVTAIGVEEVLEAVMKAVDGGR